MNLFRKSTATVALVALVSGIFSTGVSANSTSEVEAANYLAQANIINNHTANPAGYNLGQNVLRQEIAAVARGVAGLDKKESCDNVFSDVSSTTPNTWACYSVEALADAGLIALNAEFRPEANITKAEAVGMMVKAAFNDEYTFDSSKGTSWQEQVVAFAAMNGVTASFTNYDTPATRGFVFEAGAAALMSMEEDEDDILSNLLDGLLNGGSTDEDEDTTDTSIDTPTDTDNGNDVVTTPVVTGGNVEVTLNPASAVAQTIPSSGLVTFGKFDITAGSQDVSVNSIKLKREGLSNRTDISRVYFEVNSKRISSRASINIDEEAIVSFTPAVVVKAGSTETLELVIELANPAKTGAEHRFAIVEVEASANVVSNFPVRTNTMRVGSYAVSSVTFDPTSPTSTVEVNVGDKNVILGEFQLITGGDRDNLFKSVTFRNNGGADLASTITNLGLYNDGKKVSTEVVMAGRDVTFIVNSLIENGRTENYEIRADILGADRDGDELQFELRNETDLNVVEVATSFSAPVDLISSLRTMEKYSVKGGELLLSRDTSFTNSDTVSASTNDVVLLSANLRVDEAITIEDLTMSYEATGTSLFDQYRDLKLVVDGRTISTYTPISTGTDTNTGVLRTFDFDGTFLVSNNSNIKVLGNLKNNAANNSSLEIKDFTLNNTTTRDIRYVSNDERPTLGSGFGIAGTVQGITVTVAEATLLVTKNDGLNNETIVAGARDVTLFGFSMRANDVSDLKVTALKPTTPTMTGMTLANITNIRLFEGENLLRTRNDFDFTSLDVTIPKNGSKTFRIVADFDNSVANNAELRLALGTAQISARNIESNQLLTNITGVNSSLFTVVSSGTITINSNSSTRPSSIVTPSGSQVDVFTFDLEAKNDKLRLTDLYVTQTGTTLNLADAVSSTSLSVNGRVIDGAVVSSGVLYFPIGNSNPIIVDRDETVKLEIRLAFNDSNDRTPESFQLVIGNGSYTPVNGTVNGLRLVSDSTGQTLTTVSVSGVQSQSHLLARSKPVVAVNASSVTREVLYRFSVTADSNRYIDLNDFDFNVNSISGVTYSDVSLRVNNSNGTVVGSFDADVANFALAGVYANGYRVSAGQTIDFYLTATVDDSARTTTYTRNAKLINIEFNDSTDDVTTASTYDNTGLEADTVSFTVNK